MVYLYGLFIWFIYMVYIYGLLIVVGFMLSLDMNNYNTNIFINNN